MNNKAWIGVDFDGTLARYDGWVGADYLGEPIPLMVQRVKDWLADGIRVKIFTARVWENPELPDNHRIARHSIERFCLMHFGQVLEVTNIKDYEMIELWDDRAVGVYPNTGVRIG